MPVFDSAKVRIVRSPVVTGLPTSFVVEYAGEDRGGTQFIVIRPRENWSYEDFVVLLSDGAGDGQFEAAKVNSVVRYRDGGTTEIKTDRGEFYFPSCFAPEKKATLDASPVILYPDARI